jgi:hypothetical protein
VHSTVDGRDDLYDIQMIPVEAQGAIRWSVLAQHGKTGSKLTGVTKLEAESHDRALRTFNSWRTAKQARNFLSVSTARLSDFWKTNHQITEDALASVAQTLPNWPGLEEGYTEAQRFLFAVGKHVADADDRSTKSWSAGPAIILADLAYNSGEGLSEARKLINSLDTSDVLDAVARLSPEARAWFGTEAASTVVGANSGAVATMLYLMSVRLA